MMSSASFPRLPIILSLIIWWATAQAQSDPIFTQYRDLPALYNPAAAGETDFVRLRAGGRLQWLGIDNAPRSFVATADSPFKLFNRRFGGGVTMMQESLGLFSTLLLNAQLNYMFRIRKGEMRIGIQAGYYNSRFRGSDVFIPDGDDYHDPDDPAIPKRDLSGNALDLSIGAKYIHPLFDVGLSLLHANSPSVKLSQEGSEAAESQEYETRLYPTIYFNAGGNIKIKNSLFQLQPSLLAVSDFSGLSLDLTIRGVYNRFISLGAGYRWKEAVSVMAGAEFKNFYLGYAYSYPLSAIAKASSGSHEIVAGYSLRLDLKGKNRNKHRSIRIM